MELQTSLALLDAPPTPGRTSSTEEDKYGRVPYHQRPLENVENITSYAKEHLLDRQRLAQLADRYGLAGVIRWKPKQVQQDVETFVRVKLTCPCEQIKNLRGSGIDTVLAHTLYAIVGAIALQKGGEVANQTVRHRILNPLGIV